MVNQRKNSFKNHKAIVLGASQGIGREIAVKLASLGAEVAVLARDENALKETVTKCEQAGGQAFHLSVDVSDSSASETAFKESVVRLGGLDVVVLSQGVNYRQYFVNDQQASWRHILNVNLIACMQWTHLALPYLINGNKNHHRGIAYIASISGKAPYAGGSAYCASKAGLIAFSQSIFEEVREFGVKISAICPGYVNTSMVNTSPSLDASKMIQPEDIAEIATEIMMSASTICPVEVVVRPQQSPYIQHG